MSYIVHTLSPQRTYNYNTNETFDVTKKVKSKIPYHHYLFFTTFFVTSNFSIYLPVINLVCA